MATAVYPSSTLEVINDAKSPLTLSSSVAACIALEPGFHEASLFSTAQWKLLLVPRLACAKVYTTVYTDYLKEVTDKTSATHMALDAMTTTRIAYFGTTDIVRGFYFDIGTNVNANAATLDVEYWNGSAWADVAGDSDGTTSDGATLAVDGLYTWTVPASMAATGTNLGLEGFLTGELLHWICFKPSATLSNVVDLAEVVPVSKRTAYMLMEGGFHYQFSVDVTRTGGIQVLSVTGTPALDIGWGKH